MKETRRDFLGKAPWRLAAITGLAIGLGTLPERPGCWGLYDNINLEKPTSLTDPVLVQAYNVLLKRAADISQRTVALKQLGDAYDSLKVADLFDGRHSFIKPTLERIATDEEDPLNDQAAKIIDLAPLHRLFRKHDEEEFEKRKREAKNPEDLAKEALYFDLKQMSLEHMGKRYERDKRKSQKGSDFQERLLGIDLANTTEKLIVCYAIARHGVAGSAEYAGNQLGVAALGVFPETAEGARPLGRFLFSEIVKKEKDEYWKSKWEYMLNKLTPEAVRRGREKREQEAASFKERYGINPQEVTSIAQLRKLVPKDNLVSKFNSYLGAKPQLGRQEEEGIRVGISTVGDMDEFNRLHKEILRYNNQLVWLNRTWVFIIPY